MKDIYYQISGEGFPIVFLHGNGEDHHIFDQAVLQLSKQYQCICIDSRYHGQSIHAGELSYQQMAKDVMGVVAVSYTHLDVYKRQPLALILAFMARKIPTGSKPRCS